MSGLPWDIITEILSRLPVKSLLRLRCVSKPWCFLIDTPYFVKTHLTRSIENHANLTIILIGTNRRQNKSTLYSLDFYSPHTPIVFSNEYKNHFVLGSCNGLLLLKPPPDDQQLVLFNRTTRQHRNVPAIPIEYPDYCTVVELYGFGYDSFENDYKVISVVQCYESLECVKNEAKVYSLESNLWRKISDFPCYIVDDCSDGWGNQVSGVLHIIATESYDFDSPKLIVGFHVAEENFNLVPKPDFMKNDKVDMSLGVLSGCLCLMGSYPDYGDVSVMKAYGVKKSWTKLLSISSPYVSLRPLAFSKSRDEVLLNLNENELIWYDLKSREIRKVKICGLSMMFYVDVCVGSLVPLDGYGGSDKPKKQHNKEKKEVNE